MGPVRRGLTSAASLMFLPTALFARSCADMRPGWTADTPPSALNEALFLLTTGPNLFLLAATAVALFLRSQWGGLVVVVLWAAFITLLTTVSAPHAQDAAHANGCAGSPTLFIGLVAAICVATVLYTMPHSRGD